MSVETNKRLLKKYFAARYIADKGIFRYEIFCQAVQLAMEQVQEVELTVLKSKQETKIESVLIDILVLYFLEAKVIGSIVQRSSQAFVDLFSGYAF